MVLVQELSAHRFLACVCIVFIIAVPCFTLNAVPSAGKSGESQAVKNELIVKPPIDTKATPVEVHAIDGKETVKIVPMAEDKPRNGATKANTSEPVIIAAASPTAAVASPAARASSNAIASPAAAEASSAAAAAGSAPMPDHMQVEESDFKQKVYQDDEEIPDSVRYGFYFLLLLSSSAIIFIVVKVYGLRLSRAERKYGVQGDRTTQELTPLPISIEDGNSDEEDQTLFEINRQQIRIL